jgi:hypothetical protein
MDQDHSTKETSVPPGKGGRTERALKFYDSVEKLSPEARDALERFIESLHASQKKANGRKRKPDSAKR